MKNLYDKTFQDDVSVVIPVFNRASTISYCIESIVNQTFLPKEIICVDDCSTDDTKDVIIALSKKYTNVAIKYFCLDKNSGANVARSHGIKKSSSMWIAFHDSDDEWEPDKLEKQMMVVREHEYTENIVVHGNCTVVDHASGKSFLWQLPLIDGNAEFVHKRLLCAPGPAFPCILTSKKALETVGMLDGNVPAYQEWDTSLLLSKICRFIHLPDSLFRYHVHNGSIFRKPKRDFLGYQYILDKWKDEIALYCNELQRYRHFRVQIIKLIDLNERANAKKYINEYFKDGDMFLKFIWLCVAGFRGRGIRLVDVLVYLRMYGVNGVMKRMLNKNKEQKFGGGVSVIIPTYNREQHILCAVESVIAQDYKNVEVLVCDDFSTDGTEAVVKKYILSHSNVRFLQRPDGKKGANWARNYGIECAKGEYIAFLDSDDELLPNSLSVRVEVLEKHPEIDMVYGDVAVDNVRHKYDKIQEYNQNKYLMEELSLCCFIVIMVRKNVFDEVPLLDVTLKSWQDDNLVLNLNKYKKAMFHCGKTVANIRRVDESISTNYWNLYHGLKTILDLYHDEIIEGASRFRFFLWKIRLFNDYCLARSAEEYLSLNTFIFRIAHKGTLCISKIFFRHIYG